MPRQDLQSQDKSAMKAPVMACPLLPHPGKVQYVPLPHPAWLSLALSQGYF